jgi:hypothetical protein
MEFVKSGLSSDGCHARALSFLMPVLPHYTLAFAINIGPAHSNQKSLNRLCLKQFSEFLYRPFGATTT